jgi:hypothetical protein
MAQLVVVVEEEHLLGEHLNLIALNIIPLALLLGDNLHLHPHPSSAFPQHPLNFPHHVPVLPKSPLAPFSVDFAY